MFRTTTRAAGSAAIEVLGETIGTDTANCQQADAAFFECLRDKKVLNCMVAELAGETGAKAKAGEKTKTLKAIVIAHLKGADGRVKVERWVPRWTRFAPSAYIERGGVTTAVEAYAVVEEARAGLAARKPEPATGREGETQRRAA